MTLTLISESPHGIIVTGPGQEIMRALLSPALARSIVDEAHAVLARVRDELLRHDLEVAFLLPAPPPDASILERLAHRSYLAAHTDECRARIVGRIRHVRKALRGHEATLAELQRRTGVVPVRAMAAE